MIYLDLQNKWQIFPIHLIQVSEYTLKLHSMHDVSGQHAFLVHFISIIYHLSSSLFVWIIQNKDYFKNKNKIKRIDI